MSTPVYNCTEPGGDHLSSQDRADPCSVPTGFGMTTPATVGGKAFLIAYGLFGCAGTILFFNLFLERIISLLAFIMREAHFQWKDFVLTRAEVKTYLSEFKHYLSKTESHE